MAIALKFVDFPSRDHKRSVGISVFADATHVDTFSLWELREAGVSTEDLRETFRLAATIAHSYDDLRVNARWMLDIPAERFEETAEGRRFSKREPARLAAA
jgi:hypothetical protein